MYNITNYVREDLGKETYRYWFGSHSFTNLVKHFVRQIAAFQP